MFDLGNIVAANATFPAQKILVYGPPGLGKTTLGTTFEKPILLRTEDGAAALDVPTFPKLAESMDEVRQAISALCTPDHGFKTLVIDSLDWLEPIVWRETCARLNVPSIESQGYGKGYVEAESEWRTVISLLDILRTWGVNVVLIAHSEVKRVEPPDSDPYDRYQIKLHKRAWALWQEWCDMLLFTNYERRMLKTKEGKKAGDDKFRAEGTGERVIYTDERPAFLAKNRWSLPAKIRIGQDKTWAGFHAALNQATAGRYLIPATANQAAVPAGEAE